MGKILDFAHDRTIAAEIVAFYDDNDYDAAQMIAGLCMAIHMIAGLGGLPWQVIDEATDALQDGYEGD